MTSSSRLSRAGGPARVVTAVLASALLAGPALAGCSGEATVSQPTTPASSSTAAPTSASSSAAASPSSSAGPSAVTSTSSTSSGPATTSTSSTGSGTGPGPGSGTGPGTTVRLAFGGDTNTANAAGRVLSDGMGSAAAVLGKADLAMVNIETVLSDTTAGLDRQPKAYNFLAPTRLLDVVAKAGVDVVTVANNHGLDYGRPGLRHTLAARSPSRPHLIGAGMDFASAFSPYRTTVRGRGVMFLAATDVIDAGLQWDATTTRPGLASIKTSTGYAELRRQVRQDRAAHPDDVIVVYLHDGVELHVCPSARQQRVARDLASDGASVVLMSHAHVVQPGAVTGTTAVDYGLGNFVFAAQSAATAQTGVLEVDVPPAGAPTEVWHPGHISAGIPTLLMGSAADAARARWKGLGDHC